MEELKNEEIQQNQTVDTEAPLDKNVRLMSPTRMVVRRFFRSKLSILGLIMVIGLFIFSFSSFLLFRNNLLIKLSGIRLLHLSIFRIFRKHRFLQLLAGLVI